MMVNLKQISPPQKPYKELSSHLIKKLERSSTKTQTFHSALIQKSSRIFKTSKSTSSLCNLKALHKISFSDFWSGRMKAEVRHLEKKLNPFPLSPAFPKDPQTIVKFPKTSRTDLKSNKFYLKSSEISSKPLKLIPALERLIVDCDLIRKKTRRLSVELSNSKDFLKKELKISNFLKNKFIN